MIYKVIFGAEMNFDSSSTLKLNMNEEKSREFMERLYNCKIRLPPMTKIEIMHPTSFDRVLRDFLQYCFPMKCEIFTFNMQYSGQPKMNDFRKALADCLPRVSREIFFYYITAEQREFEEILSSSCQCERLIIYWSTVYSSSRLRLKIPSKTNLEYFSLQYTGLSGYSEWQNNPNKLENIIRALNDTALSDSMRTLNV